MAFEYRFSWSPSLILLSRCGLGYQCSNSSIVVVMLSCAPPTVRPRSSHAKGERLLSLCGDHVRIYRYQGPVVIEVVLALEPYHMHAACSGKQEPLEQERELKEPAVRMHEAIVSLRAWFNVAVPLPPQQNSRDIRLTNTSILHCHESRTEEMNGRLADWCNCRIQ